MTSAAFLILCSVVTLTTAYYCPPGAKCDEELIPSRNAHSSHRKHKSNYEDHYDVKYGSETDYDRGSADRGEYARGPQDRRGAHSRTQHASKYKMSHSSGNERPMSEYESFYRSLTLEDILGVLKGHDEIIDQLIEALQQLKLSTKIAPSPTQKNGTVPAPKPRILKTTTVVTKPVDVHDEPPHAPLDKGKVPAKTKEENDEKPIILPMRLTLTHDPNIEKTPASAGVIATSAVDTTPSSSEVSTTLPPHDPKSKLVFRDMEQPQSPLRYRSHYSYDHTPQEPAWIPSNQYPHEEHYSGDSRRTSKHHYRPSKYEMEEY